MYELPANMPNDLKLRTSTGTSEIPQIKGEHLFGHSKQRCLQLLLETNKTLTIQFSIESSMLLYFTTQTSFTFFAKKCSLILPLKILEKSSWAGFCGLNSLILWVTMVELSWPSLEASFQYQWKFNKMQLKVIYPAKIVRKQCLCQGKWTFSL